MNLKISFVWAVVLLLTESLLIPLMWITGHRANNSFIAFCLLFVILYHISPDLKEWFNALITRISQSRVQIKRSFVVLCVIELFLAVMSLQFNIHDGLWDLDWEGGVGTTYSGFLLAVVTMLTFFCYRVSDQRVARIAWMIFGTLLLLMTIDELSEFHHGLAESVWNITTGQNKFNLAEGFSFWIIVLSPFIFSIIIGIVWFIRKVLHGESRIIAYVALLCWIASQALESTINLKIMPHIYEVLCEESLEMLGTTLFIVAFFHEYRTLLSLPSEEALLQADMKGE